MKKYLTFLAIAAVGAFVVGCQTDEADEPAGAETESQSITITTNQQWDSESGTQDNSSQSDGTSGDSGVNDGSGSGSGGVSQP